MGISEDRTGDGSWQDTRAEQVGRNWADRPEPSRCAEPQTRPTCSTTCTVGAYMYLLAISGMYHPKRFVSWLVDV